MGRKEKRLEKMRANPRGWRIRHVQALCQSYRLALIPPTGGGSHWTVGHPSQFAKITVVAGRPIKPFYIRRLVSFVDNVQVWRENVG
jgi:hypothetical protein